SPVMITQSAFVHSKQKQAESGGSSSENHARQFDSLRVAGETPPSCPLPTKQGHASLGARLDSYCRNIGASTTRQERVSGPDSVPAECEKGVTVPHWTTVNHVGSAG
ncbi:hypothetical protein KUCAC02_008528, partial [Chaenocephalus aceratus]